MPIAVALPDHDRARRALTVMAALVIAAAVTQGDIRATRAADASTEAGATTWDYRAVFVVWDDEAQDWRADWTDGPSTVGLEAVLDAEGAVGWELVEIAHERFDTIEVEGATMQDARRLRLIFKREGAAAGPSDPLVSISGFSFQPASIEVGTGTSVRWENEDGAPHTVTAADRSFDSGTLGSGASFEFAFDAPGTYPYACAIHPSMTGTVVVS